VDPKGDLDDVMKRKLLTLPALELRPLGRPVAVLTELSRILRDCCHIIFFSHHHEHLDVHVLSESVAAYCL
jgi:hypothetical protein